RRDLLAFRRVEILEVGFGDLAGALLVDVLVDDRDRRLSEDAQRGNDDLELVGTQLLDRQLGFILPGDEDVADAALDERRRRTASTRVEHRDVLVELGDKLLRLVGAAILLVGVVPSSEIVPLRAARGLRIRRDDRDTFLSEIVPVLDALRIALAD